MHDVYIAVILNEINSMHFSPFELYATKKISLHRVVLSKYYLLTK